MFEIRKERFPEKEQRILDFWKEMEIFKLSLEQREGGLPSASTMALHSQRVFLTMVISWRVLLRM